MNTNMRLILLILVLISTNAQATDFLRCEIKTASTSLPMFPNAVHDWKKKDKLFSVSVDSSNIKISSLLGGDPINFKLEFDSIALIGSTVTAKFVFDKETKDFGLAFLAPPLPRLFTGSCSE